MTVALVGIALVLLLAAVAYLPFLNERRQRQQDAAAATLEDQLHRWVNAVRDLDFDYDTGKIAQEDYITQRKLLIGRGVSTMIKLDEARHAERQQEQALEDEIAALRLKKKEV